MDSHKRSVGLLVKKLLAKVPETMKKSSKEHRTQALLTIKNLITHYQQEEEYQSFNSKIKQEYQSALEIFSPLKNKALSKNNCEAVAKIADKLNVIMAIQVLQWEYMNTRFDQDYDEIKSDGVE